LILATYQRLRNKIPSFHTKNNSHTIFDEENYGCQFNRENHGMEPEKGRWMLVILGMIINLCLGSIYSWSVFVGPLTTYFTKTWARQLPPVRSCCRFQCFSHSLPSRCHLPENISKKYGPRNITIVGGCLTGLGWISHRLPALWSGSTSSMG